eukprot:5147199-Amphidinium_carterae.2
MPLPGDKNRFHWSVSHGAGDWQAYPGHHQGLSGERIAVVECTHGHSTSHTAAATSAIRLTPELCDTLGCEVHGTKPSYEASIKQNGLMRMARHGQDARTSIHFAAYRQQAGIQSHHDYGLHVYLCTAVGD